MKGLREKFHSKKGFTLVEMLIVVAIIAILIAISIPLVTNALESARDATDDANFRSAAGLGTITYLTEGKDAAGEYYYHTNKASQGKLVKKDETAPTGYEKKYVSQCQESAGSHTQTGTKQNQNIKVEIDGSGEVTVSWVDAS